MQKIFTSLYLIKKYSKKKKNRVIFKYSASASSNIPQVIESDTWEYVCPHFFLVALAYSLSYRKCYAWE